MKKTFRYAFVFMLVFQTVSLGWWTGDAHAACSPEGDGSEECPFIVTDAVGLSGIRHNLSAHYRLGANIDLAGYDYDGAGPDDGGWMPIGAVSDSTSNAFTGTLEGNGYAIRNMTIDRPSMRFVGLFGQIGTMSSPAGDVGLSNVRLIDVRIRGSESAGALTGNLLKGSIENSFATGSVIVSNFNAGGLAGVSQGWILDSYSAVHVSGWTRIGGIVGTNVGLIRNSFAAGSVRAGSDEVGGLTGYVYPNSDIQDSYAAGTVSGAPGLTGGLVGRADGGSLTSRSFWNTDTSGLTGSAGGIGLTTVEMKEAAFFSDWDPAIWAFRPGELYPYLRAFGMGIAIDPLPAMTYSLHPGQDMLSVTGSLFHETAGEPLSVKYDIRNSANVSVISAVYGAISDGGSSLSINRKFSLFGLSDGDYTIAVTAEDTRNAAVGGTLAFTVDAAAPQPPSIGFGTHGSEIWAQSASTSVTVGDSGGGIDAATLQYVWSTDQAAPYAGWSSFSNGQTLSKSGIDGDWYLHVRAKDSAGNPANATSNRFRVNTSSAMLSGLTLSAGELGPAFAGSAFTYEARVANGVSGLTVTAVAAHAQDTIEISVNGGVTQTVASGIPSEQLALREGTNAIRVDVAALNGEQNAYSVSVYRTPSSSSSSSSSGSSAAPDKDMKPVVAIDSDGGVIVTVNADMINKAVGPDGDFSERVDLGKETLDAALDLLQEASKPRLTIVADDSEREVRVTLPAEWLARTDAAVPNAVIEVRLSGSSLKFVIRALDLKGLVARLGAEAKDLNIHVTMERIAGQTEQEIGRTASASGARVIGNIVAYRISAETAVGQRTNLGDNGITDTVRAVVSEEISGLENWTVVRYDSVASTISFVPAVLAVRPDGKREVAIRAPKDGIYAVLATNVGFGDLDGHWAKKDIELLASKLILRGVTDLRFAPNADVTRAEFAALLVRALGLPTSPTGGSSQFSDVPAGSWYAPFVEAATNAGLVNGTSQERFAPNEPVTREQMAVMIVKALLVADGQENDGNPGSVGNGVFTDWSEISSWAQASVTEAAAAGLVSGMPDGTFAPSETANRAQAAALLKRLLLRVRFIE